MLGLVWILFEDNFTISHHREDWLPLHAELKSVHFVSNLVCSKLNNTKDMNNKLFNIATILTFSMQYFSEFQRSTVLPICQMLLLN